MRSPEELADNKRCVLFLVDHSEAHAPRVTHLAPRRTYPSPDDGRKFTELYNVQHLQSALLDRVSISTIQRLCSMLRGEEIDSAIDERSGYELRESLLLI